MILHKQYTMAAMGEYPDFYRVVTSQIKHLLLTHYTEWAMSCLYLLKFWLESVQIGGGGLGLTPPLEFWFCSEVHQPSSQTLCVILQSVVDYGS